MIPNKEALLEVLAGAGRRALEIMFFEVPDVSNDPQRPAGELVASSLNFAGEPPGSFAIVVSAPVAKSLAANFLGAENEQDITPDQVGDVVGEFSNIVCGSVLTEIEPKAHFDLSAPLVVHVQPLETAPPYCLGSPLTSRLELSNGSILLYLALEETP